MEYDGERHVKKKRMDKGRKRGEYANWYERCRKTTGGGVDEGMDERRLIYGE